MTLADPFYNDREQRRIRIAVSAARVALSVLTVAEARLAVDALKQASEETLEREIVQNAGGMPSRLREAAEQISGRSWSEGAATYLLVLGLIAHYRDSKPTAEEAQHALEKLEKELSTHGMPPLFGEGGVSVFGELTKGAPTVDGAVDWLEKHWGTVSKVGGFVLDKLGSLL
jgi:hypothetical protein